MAKEVAEEYASSLADLTMNSKPLINMLTILAEENIDHAGVIVETVEKHLEKVPPEIKLPVLYLVDSIIKNVGGAYTQKFSQSIVNMFTRTFKQVDEKIRSQMFKLRETWHDVFPATKLYQLDVKVNLIDPAWPIQAQPQQSNIHVNPNFLKKNVPTTSVAPTNTPTLTEDEEKMRSILAKKEQELLMLQRKKIEMELEQTRRQLELAEKNVKKVIPPPVTTMPVAMASVVPPAVVTASVPVAVTPDLPLSAKARLGPPVSKPSVGRIAPVSGPLAGARRDPRLARARPPPPAPAPPRMPVVSTLPPVVPQVMPVIMPPVSMPQTAPIASNVFDIKPLERFTKRKNVITIDVDPAAAIEARVPKDVPRDPRRRRPDVRPDRNRNRDRQRNRENKIDNREPKLDNRELKLDTREPKFDNREHKLDNREPKLDNREHKLDNGDHIERKREDKPEKKKPDDEKPPKKLDEDRDKKRDEAKKSDSEMEVKKVEEKPSSDLSSVDRYIDQIPDPKKINKLPPIPKINRDEPKDKETPSPVKRKKELVRPEKKKKKENSKEPSSSGSSPEKKVKSKEGEKKAKQKEKRVETEVKPVESEEVVAFKELKNYHKERYRRNRELSASPEPLPAPEPQPAPVANAPEVLENKDVDLRVLSVPEPKPAVIAQKRSSTEMLDGKPNKKNKLDKFDRLFGNEDVDLRQLPQVEELSIPPPPPIITESPTKKIEIEDKSPQLSPKLPKLKDWHEIKEKTEEVKKTPSKLDLVRAKLAEATKGKDRLGRPLLFSKSPSVEKERRRTISSEDTDLRTENTEDFDAEDHKKTISIIMNQAKEQYSDGKLDESQYNALMFQVLQLNEKLKLKEAKQRESLEISKRKLKAHIEEENHKIAVPKSSPNTFGDIDERVPPMFLDTPPDSQGFTQDSDMRVAMVDTMDVPRPPVPPNSLIPPPPVFMGIIPNANNWRGQMRPRVDDFGPRRFRGPMPPYYRGGKFDKRGARPPFDALMPNMPSMPIAPLPTPQIGMCQGECPLIPYQRCESPPPLGTPGVITPPTDFKIVEYIDQDPVKTIQIDGTPREIRFYGDTAIIMLDWDDPREIKFLPGCRRVTFDNKDSVVLHFNEPYKQIEIDDQVFDIRFGAPTRELYINGRWFESFFGGQPLGVLIDGKPRLVQLEGPLPQVDIGKLKRTDLVAGKINLIVNATQMCPVYLDAKVQKVVVNNSVFTLRFADALRTVLINEQPFKVEYGDLPKPITIGNEKYFIRFSALPRNIKPGFVQLAGMEGSNMMIPRPLTMPPSMPVLMDIDQEQPRPPKTPSPERESQGLNMLASVMPCSMEAPASASAYSVAEPLFIKPDKIPGLEAPGPAAPEENPPVLPILGNINVNDLFAKLVATGIVPLPTDAKPNEEAKEEVKPKTREEKNVIHHVDWLKPETLRVKQPGLVSKLYGGMQCSGCGTRFPPEQTVRYSQHLDWHFRQNRRERDSARRAHSRHWHYDITDWLQYEELEDAEEREKSWFETGGDTESEAPLAPSNANITETPSVRAGPPTDAACTLCGDRFHQFYNEDTEEWHLRNSVKFEEKNYHPLCLEDYKASLAKEEPPKEEIAETTVDEEVIAIALDKDEPIEIKDLDETASQSDTDDVVEVVDTEPVPEEPPVEIDENDDDGDEDDVVLKQEPVVQVEVADDEDTDDETTEERKKRDEQAKIDLANVKVKQEPVDPDDDPVIAEEQIVPLIDTTQQITVLSSIDGNVQLDAAPVPTPSIPAGGIRINISKAPTVSTIPTITSSSFLNPPSDDKSLEDISVDDEPLPPGEEPELEYSLKPSLEGVQLSRQPPTQKGNELSGLCSIM